MAVSTTTNTTQPATPNSRPAPHSSTRPILGAPVTIRPTSRGQKAPRAMVMLFSDTMWPRPTVAGANRDSRTVKATTANRAKAVTRAKSPSFHTGPTAPHRRISMAWAFSSAMPNTASRTRANDRQDHGHEHRAQQARAQQPHLRPPKLQPCRPQPQPARLHQVVGDRKPRQCADQRQRRGQSEQRPDQLRRARRQRLDAPDHGRQQDRAPGPAPQPRQGRSRRRKRLAQSQNPPSVQHPPPIAGGGYSRGP